MIPTVPVPFKPVGDELPVLLADRDVVGPIQLV